eukprot:2923906-Rhodomonas_salina.1
MRGREEREEQIKGEESAREGERTVSIERERGRDSKRPSETEKEIGRRGRGDVEVRGTRREGGREGGRE